ncbi:ABC transporter substrate-binding protein [Pseudorhodoplanes sp.]|uniref:ABC transporter substrate-binding protein n=1 Tax=Pseudorhodoplanes sp. TaxID=1934341 RepID=UPI003D0C9889
MTRATNMTANAIFTTALGMLWLSLPVSAYGQKKDAQAAPPPIKVTVGVTAVGAVQWPYYVAEAKGFYKEANIDIQVTAMESNTRTVQALIGGGVHIAGGSPDPLLKAVATGNADLIIVGSVINRPIYSFVTRGDIRSFNDLKGKRVGVSALKSMDGLWMDEVLKKNGVRNEVEVVEIGGTSARYAALRANAIAGAWLGQPQDFKAISEGFRLLGYSTMAYDQLIWSSYSTSRKIAEKDPELIERFLAVQRKAHRWLYDPANKEEAIRILAEKSNTALKDAAATYDLWIGQESLSKNGEATSAGIQSMIGYLVAAGELKNTITVNQVFENKFMERVLAK